MSEVGIRINVLVKFLNLYITTIRECRLPTIEEIMQSNHCCRSNAYNYLNALKYLFPQEFLDQIRRERNTIQQTL